MTKLEQAKDLLVHYFKLASAVTTNDNAVEIESIIDLIADAVEERTLERVGPMIGRAVDQ